MGGEGGRRRGARVGSDYSLTGSMVFHILLML